MNSDYIFKFEDAQGINYPELRFIQVCHNRAFGIFNVYGGGNVELAIDRVSLNEAGMKLGQVALYSLVQGSVVDPWNDMIAFHKKFGIDYDGPPRILDEKLLKFRNDFIDEEHKEFKMANTDNKRLDAVCDLIYVLLGYARLRGWNFPEAWRRVQAKNMSKMRAKDTDDKRHATDVIKPPDFVPPDHTDLVTISK